MNKIKNELRKIHDERKTYLVKKIGINSSKKTFNSYNLIKVLSLSFFGVAFSTFSIIVLISIMFFINSTIPLTELPVEIIQKHLDNILVFSILLLVVAFLFIIYSIVLLFFQKKTSN